MEAVRLSVGRQWTLWAENTTDTQGGFRGLSLVMVGSTILDQNKALNFGHCVKKVWMVDVGLKIDGKPGQEFRTRVVCVCSQRTGGKVQKDE